MFSDAKMMNKYKRKSLSEITDLNENIDKNDMDDEIAKQQINEPNKNYDSQDSGSQETVPTTNKKLKRKMNLWSAQEKEAVEPFFRN